MLETGRAIINFESEHELDDHPPSLREICARAGDGWGINVHHVAGVRLLEKRGVGKCISNHLFTDVNSAEDTNS